MEEVKKESANLIAKKAVVQEIIEKIKSSKSVVLVEYDKLTVAEVSELRNKCRQANCEYKVYKNTMMNFAFKGTDYEALTQYLEGPSAIAISDTDATAPARIICNFAKTAEKLELKGGVVEGNVYDVAGLTELSKIPSREVLLSRLLGSMQSPITNFARVIKQIAEKDGETAEAPAESAEAPAEAAE